MKDLLNKHFPILFDNALKEKLIEVSKLSNFKKGDVLLKRGQYIKLLPLVIQGAIKVVREDKDGHEILIYYIKSGESCALSFSAYMNDKKSDITAICDQDTKVILIPSRLIKDWIQLYPSWQQFALQLYDLRFEEILHAVDEIAFKKMDERLLSYLEEKIRLQQSKTLKITHQQIANDLATSREVITRLLKQMTQKGMIQLARNEIKIIGFV